MYAQITLVSQPILRNPGPPCPGYEYADGLVLQLQALWG